MRRGARLTLAAMVGLAAAAGCSKRTTEPPPGDSIPPQIEEMFPAPRATRVPLEPEIWMRFHAPLDSTTATPQYVFLKLDTRRIPIRVTLGADRRTVGIEPLEPLTIRRTHTIELSPDLRSRDGAELGESYFWQFTTVSLRRIEAPGPAAAAVDRGPLQPLTWQGTEAVAGPVEYRVWAAEDSSAVAAESGTPALTTKPLLLAPNPWRLGGRFYWKVRARNLETGDEEAGPVWSFGVLPAGTPIDSITVPFRDSGTWVTSRRTWVCPDLQLGMNQGPIARFSFDALDPGLRLAGATLLLRSQTTFNGQQPVLWELDLPWRPCDFGNVGVAPARGILAYGFHIEAGLWQFSSFLLGTHVQARIARQEGLLDYTLRSERTLIYSAGSSPGMRLYYYAVPS